MNIMMISDVYFPRVNGVSTSMQTFCRELVGRGHAVTIVAPDYGVAEGETEFEMIRLPSRRIFFDPEDRLIRKSAARSIVHDLARPSRSTTPTSRNTSPIICRGFRRRCCDSSCAVSRAAFAQTSIT